MVDAKRIIKFLEKHGAMGTPEESPWPHFDPETQERVAVDLDVVLPHKRGKRVKQK